MKRTADELGGILAEMYNSAPPKKLVTMVHLFAVQHSDDIQSLGKGGIKEVVRVSGIGSNYNAEVNKGVNLAEYVVPKYIHKQA